MVAIESGKHPKREYILVKIGTLYYYARAERDNPRMYVAMVHVGKAEGEEIVSKANASSDFNNQWDKEWKHED